MATTKIELREIRDFGTVFSDVFAFIKQEFKPMLKSVLLYAGIFILVTAIFSGLANGNHSYWQKIFTPINDSYNNGYVVGRSDPFAFFTFKFLLYFISAFITQACVITTIACYMKLYKQKGNESPTPQEVWELFRHYFFRVLLVNFVLGLLVWIGFLFCLAPGFYFGTILAPLTFVIVFEDESSLSYIYNRCAGLSKENFWINLGLYLVLYIVCYACSMIVGVIFGIVAGLIGYFTTKDFAMAFGAGSGILSIAQHIFVIIFYIGIGFNYFSLVEKVDGTGLLEKINQMGNNESNIDNEQAY